MSKPKFRVLTISNSIVILSYNFHTHYCKKISIDLPNTYIHDIFIYSCVGLTLSDNNVVMIERLVFI